MKKGTTCNRRMNVTFPEVNECFVRPCENGFCTDGDNTYTCTCDDGFKGVNCSGILKNNYGLDKLNSK